MITKEELDKKIENLTGWLVMYDEKILSLQNKINKFRHSGYPSEPQDPSFLGMSSIEQRKPSITATSDQVLDNHLDRATQFHSRLLLVREWREDVLKKIEYLQNMKIGI